MFHLAVQGRERAEMVCLGQGGRVKYYSAFLSDLFIDSVCTCALPGCIYRESQRMQSAQNFLCQALETGPALLSSDIVPNPGVFPPCQLVN